MGAVLVIGAVLVVAVASVTTPSFAATDATKEISAQRRARVVITPAQRSGYPGRYAKRECESWLQVENRPSGQVLTPQMRCFWR
jgi:hypothetical protein